MTKKPKKTNDRPFNAFRRAKSDAVKALVTQVCSEYQATEARTRSRKPKDQKIFEEQIEAIITDAVHRYLTMPTGRVAFTSSNQILGHPERTDAPLLNKAFPFVVTTLATKPLEYLTVTKGDYKAKLQSTFAATSKLIKLAADAGITLLDLCVTKERDAIQLRATKKTGDKRGKPIKYQETEITLLYREEIEQINSFLSDADIEYHGKKAVDLSQRSLYRVFNNGKFTDGGRLYGGFWINLGKDDLSRLSIDEEPLVYLDYGQFAPRVTYFKAGAIPNFVDAYAIPSIDTKYREAIKTLTNKLLNYEKPIDKLPKEFRRYPRLYNSEGMKDEKLTAHSVIKLIKKQHPAIKDFFHKEGIFSTMFIESEIMVKVLLTLIDMEIVALSKHDGLLVKESDAHAAREVMVSVSKDYLGFSLPVNQEEI